MDGNTSVVQKIQWWRSRISEISSSSPSGQPARSQSSPAGVAYEGHEFVSGYCEKNEEDADQKTGL